jgi:secretion/DNA translocation related TadE-like protein
MSRTVGRHRKPGGRDGGRTRRGRRARGERYRRLSSRKGWRWLSLIRASGWWASVSGATNRGRRHFAGSGVVGRRWSWGVAWPSRRTGGGLGPFDRSPLLSCDERFADRGLVTVWAAGAVAAMTVVSVWLLWFGSAVVARHRAESAADLAALAAASRAVAGERRACDEARWVTGRMGVQLRSCRLSGWDALVEVVATASGVPSGFRPAVARARAGPVERDR